MKCNRLATHFGQTRSSGTDTMLAPGMSCLGVGSPAPNHGWVVQDPGSTPCWGDFGVHRPDCFLTC